jgi:hypothetical protein
MLNGIHIFSQILAFVKFEYRNPKFETNPKSKCPNDQNNGYTDTQDFEMFRSFEFW